MLRPALVLLVAGATGGIKEAHIRLGALLEMVHLASLVHDDVIDEADKRRDEATANALWGNSLAVLLGDVLFPMPWCWARNSGKAREFCRRLANTVRDVCQGEVAQSSRLYDLSMTREEYFEIIRKKNRLPVLRRYGRRGVDLRSGPGSGGIPLPAGRPAGVAYQIYDDCLDMVGDEDDAGKTLHTDATKGKLTLPIFNLLECGDRNVEATLRDAIENREVVDYSAFQDNPVFCGGAGQVDPGGSGEKRGCP